MKINMPDDARYIIEQLNNHGYEAYIVGGCVRDAVLGREPSDWDITTSALPEEVKALFRRTIDTGIQHGTVTVMLGDCGYEVTTYRVDGEYKDHRRPETVAFTRSLEEDLKRRDFTINAMAYNDADGLIDLFGGKEDLESHIIRCVGRAEDRFDEDALRILRAVRFSAQLGFEIEEETCEAIKKQAKFLANISAERIQVELTKLLLSDHTDRLEMAYNLGITKIILPEFDVMMETEQNNPYHMYDVGHHTLKVIENTPPTVILRYAALLHDSAKPKCKTTSSDGIDHFYEHNVEGEKLAVDVLRRLKLDNNTIFSVKKLVYWHDYGIGGQIGIKAMRRAMSSMGIENFDNFIAIRNADMKGQSDYKLEEKIANIEHMKALHKIIVEENQCLTLKDLKIGGKELIALGYKPGPAIGETLGILLDAVIDKPELNDKDVLTEMAREFLEIKV